MHRRTVTKKVKLSTDQIELSSIDIVPSSSNLFHEVEDISNTSCNIDVNTYSIADIVLKANNVLNFDIKNLLNNHIIGRVIILKYEKEKCINNTDCNKLCDIIICLI